jgi:hypothetical protein
LAKPRQRVKNRGAVQTPVCRGAHAIEQHPKCRGGFSRSIEMFWSVDSGVCSATTVKLLKDGIEPLGVLVKKCEWSGGFQIDRIGRKRNINNT